MVSTPQRFKRRGLGLGSALIAVLALSAVAAAASASAATQHWYAAGSKLAQKTPTEVSGKATSTFIFKWSLAGTEGLIECNSMSTAGTIENPSGGGAGTLGGGSLSLGECSVAKPAGGCTVKGSSINFNPLKGEATEVSGKPAIKYAPAAGTYFFTFTTEGCAFSGTWSAYGSLAAFAEPGKPGTYTFSGESSNGLTVAGNKASLIGSHTLATPGGQAVSIASSALSIASGHWLSAGTELAQGTPTAFASSGSMSFNVQGTIAGVETSVTCTGTANQLTGTVENPSGGGAGTASATMTLGECSVTPSAAKCTVAPVKSEPLVGTTTEAAGLPAVKFSPTEKTTIAKVTLQGPSCVMVGTYPLTGSLTATSAAGSFSLPSSVNNYAVNKLKFAGNQATASGGFTLES